MEKRSWHRTGWAVGLVLLGVAARPAGAGILNDWRYDDPAGTELALTANAVLGGTSFTGVSPGWVTDGNGFLVKTGNANAYRTAVIAPVSSGASYLRLDVDSWNFDPATHVEGTNENIGITFHDSVNFGGAERQLSHVRVVRSAPDEIILEAIGLGTVTNTVLAGLSAQDYTNGLDVVVGINVDTDTFEVYYRTGDDPFVLGYTGAVFSNGVPDRIRFHSANDFSDPGDVLRVDRLIQAETLADLGILAPFAVTHLTVSDTDGFGIETTAGREYDLQRSADGGTNWVSTGIRVVGDGSPTVLFDPDGVSTSQLYRVLALEP